MVCVLMVVIGSVYRFVLHIFFSFFRLSLLDQGRQRVRVYKLKYDIFLVLDVISVFVYFFLFVFCLFFVFFDESRL
jgi:hypothetical protein